ncbi:MAG: LON peptidase substrate-binding domain-containing protein [Armatimonadota bacterium]
MDNSVNPENEPDSSANTPEGAPQRPLSSLELPLFPLDLVLFPHMLIPLHIFEERYREMINQCVTESLPFGIVLATGTKPGSGETVTHAVGCTARIARVERLPDGRMNIEVVGESRFRILDTHETRSFRTGLTESVVDEPLTDDVGELAEEVQRLLKDFLTRSLARMGQSIEEFTLPDEPVSLSFMTACVLPIDNDEKQALLEETDTEARLALEKEVLLREVTRLRRTAETAEETQPTEVQTVEWHPVKAERFADLLSLN